MSIRANPMNANQRPVPYDPEGLLWQLADVCNSRDPALRFNERIELLPPPSRETHSPLQSRRGLERQQLAHTWRAGARDDDQSPWWPDPTAEPSLPSSTTLLPFQTRRWSDPPPPNPPPPNPPPPNPPRRRTVLGPLDPNAQTLIHEVRALEKENLGLRKHVLMQDRALVALAKLRQRPVP